MKKLALALLLGSSALLGLAPAYASTVDQVYVGTGGLSEIWYPSYLFPNSEGSPSNAFPLSNNLPVASYTAVELTDPVTGAPSDYLWYVQYATLFFASDDNGSFTGLPTLNIVASLTETGAFQDVGQYFGVGASDLQVLSADNVSPTPLPPALPLFAAGLAGLSLFGWHRKRKARVVA